MTYRQAIQIQVAALQEIYDNCEGLRDAAAGEEEKEVWNLLRGGLPNLWRALKILDDVLIDGYANRPLRGIYNVTQNDSTI
jgi:hypothetical protein